MILQLWFEANRVGGLSDEYSQAISGSLSGEKKC